MWVAAVTLAAGMGSCGSASGPAASAPTRTFPDTIGQPSCRDATNQVDLVVEASPSHIYDVCVGFHGKNISAGSVLAKSGVQFATEPKLFGQALCQVAHIPAHYSNCLPTGPMYWAIFAETVGGSWLPATEGLSTTLAPEDELGLRYESTFDSPQPPESGPPPGASPPR